MPDSDPFFEVFFDGDWNSCVGIQSRDQDYVYGYLEASLELITAVLDKKMYGSRDTLAMPILFNARHALELSLKSVINRLHALGVITERHIPNHDILSHWKLLRDAKVGDTTLRKTMLDLEPYVSSLAKIDDDGQEFRYSTNREGQKSLGTLTVINLPHIRRSLQAMSEVLSAQEYRLMSFEAEHRTGTHTKECSRADLKIIAVQIGDYGTWQSDEFTRRKANICQQFELSSRKFSAALNKIKESRPLAILVGLEFKLRFISDEKAKFALEQWNTTYPERQQELEESKLVPLSEIDASDYSNRTRDLVQIVSDNLSDEEISDIEVMYYLGRDREFGEYYDNMIDLTLRKYKNTAVRYENIYHIMSKSNLLEKVVIGAQAAGRLSLAKLLSSIRPAASE